MFGGWSVRPKVSIFFVALVGSWALFTATARARIFSSRFCGIVRGNDQLVEVPFGVASVALMVLLAVVPQVVRSSLR